MKRMLTLGLMGATALTLGTGAGAAHAEGTDCPAPVAWHGDAWMTVINNVYATGIEVPAGTYSVELAAFDSFEGRATAYEQEHEQVYVSVGDVNTPLTVDLQDSVERVDAQFNLGSLSTSGGELVLKHYYALDSSIGLSTAHSIHVVTVTLTPQCVVPPPTEAPTTVPDTTVPDTIAPTTAPGTTDAVTTVPATNPPTTPHQTTPSTLPHTGPVQSGAAIMALLILIGGVVVVSIVRMHDRRPDQV
jgi:hypothetical protein